MSSITRNLRVKAPKKYFDEDDDDSDKDEKLATVTVAKKASTRVSKAKPKLSEYEKIRLKNIQNHKEFLDKMRQAARQAKTSTKPIQKQALELVSLQLLLPLSQIVDIFGDFLGH